MIGNVNVGEFRPENEFLLVLFVLHCCFVEGKVREKEKLVVGIKKTEKEKVRIGLVFCFREHLPWFLVWYLVEINTRVGDVRKSW